MGTVENLRTERGLSIRTLRLTILYFFPTLTHRNVSDACIVCMYRTIQYCSPSLLGSTTQAALPLLHTHQLDPSFHSTEPWQIGELFNRDNVPVKETK